MDQQSNDEYAPTIVTVEGPPESLTEYNLYPNSIIIPSSREAIDKLGILKSLSEKDSFTHYRFPKDLEFRIIVASNEEVLCEKLDIYFPEIHQLLPENAHKQGFVTGEEAKCEGQYRGMYDAFNKASEAAPTVEEREILKAGANFFNTRLESYRSYIQTSA